MKSIRAKMLAALFGTILITVAGMYAFILWSFDRGFTEYVQEQELTRLDPLVTALTLRYQQDENWEDFISSGDSWLQLHRQVFEGTRGQAQGEGRRPPPPRSPGDQPPPQRGERDGAPQDDIRRRLALLDADGHWLVGNPDLGRDKTQRDLSSRQSLLAIDIDGNTVGYLGLLQPRELKNRLDQGFIAGQIQTLAVISISMLILAALVAVPLAAHLLRPLRALVNATRELISGNHQVRTPVTSRDEIGQLTTDFNELAATLEANERMRHKWISDISHELRTPIAVIKAQIEALLDGVRSPSPEVLHSLEKNANQLNTLVGDLYQLSLSDVGALDYRKEWLSVRDELTDAIEGHGHALRQAGIALELDISKLKNDKLLGDATRLQQLFDNLITNTLRYTSAPGKLSIFAESTRDGIKIAFDDSSPGVNSADLPRLFERLFRADRSRNRAAGGAGLGLSLCRSIVEAHYGTISTTHSGLGGICVTVVLKSAAGADPTTPEQLR
jgi:two-component system sensor histidine kinase BaeS